MAKELKYDVKAREAMMKGVDALANAVKVTLGPKGPRHQSGLRLATGFHCRTVSPTVP